MRITDKYVLFWKDKLGNWSKTPGIKYAGLVFPTSEHLFMYLKAMYFGDIKTAADILTTSSPRIAKDLGRNVDHFDEAAWSLYREEAMYLAVLCRYRNDPDFREEINNPEYKGKSFVEANPYDKIWAIGLSEDSKEAESEETWHGMNLLGKTLNKLRNAIKYLD